MTDELEKQSRGDATSRDSIVSQRERQERRNGVHRVCPRDSNQRRSNPDEQFTRCVVFRDCPCRRCAGTGCADLDPDERTAAVEIIRLSGSKAGMCYGWEDSRPICDCTSLGESAANPAGISLPTRSNRDCAAFPHAASLFGSSASVQRARSLSAPSTPPNP